MGTLPDNLDGLEPRPHHHFHRRNGSAYGRSLSEGAWFGCAL